MTLKGWNQQLMMSLLTKEATYGAAVVINASNFVGVKGHSDYDPDWADTVQTDKDTVSGFEHGTTLDQLTQGFKFTVAQPCAKPYFTIGMIGGALGSITPYTDPGKIAYRQTIIPATVGTALPSFNVIGKKGGLQYLHKGCMVNSFTLTGEAGKATSMEAEIIGSGARETDATGFVAEPSESWQLMKNGYAWIETSAAKSIDAAKTQGLENISSGTPRDLKAIIKKFSLKWNNNLEGQFGFGAGSAGVFQTMDYGRRTAELSMDLLHVDGTDLGYYLANTILTAEFEVKGALIAAGGTLYYGYNVVVPRFMLKKAPLPKGGVGDTLMNTYEADIQNDGTLTSIVFDGYSAQATWFA
jgi:hypothetical protein